MMVMEMTGMLTPIVVFLFTITGLSLPYFIYVAHENKVLRESYDECNERFKKALDDWRDCIDDYAELSDKYRKLLACYSRAYDILEEHGLLPGDEE